MLSRFCNIDYSREIAIVAEANTNGKRRIVGVGRLVIQPGTETGEFATLVTTISRMSAWDTNSRIF